MDRPMHAAEQLNGGRTEKFAAVFEKPVAYILLELEGSFQLPYPRPTYQTLTAWRWNSNVTCKTKTA